MSTPDHDNLTWGTCRRVVRALIAEYEWQIVSEDALVEQVAGSAGGEPTPVQVEKLAKRYYAIALYEACWQSKNPDRRERGYHELHRFLFCAAYNRWRGLAVTTVEDITQQALLLIYVQIDRCSSPASFLGFAFYKLLHAGRNELGGPRAMDENVDDDMIASIPALQETTSAQLSLEQAERVQALSAAISRLPPRMQTVILQKLEGLSDEEIGDTLGVTANNIRVLRNRALKVLRRDERLRADLGLGSEK